MKNAFAVRFLEMHGKEIALTCILQMAHDKLVLQAQLHRRPILSHWPKIKEKTGRTPPAIGFHPVAKIIHPLPLV
jgi:hypothetical protein